MTRKLAAAGAALLLVLATATTAIGHEGGGGHMGGGGHEGGGHEGGGHFGGGGGTVSGTSTAAGTVSQGLASPDQEVGFRRDRGYPDYGFDSCFQSRRVLTHYSSRSRRSRVCD